MPNHCERAERMTWHIVLKCLKCAITRLHEAAGTSAVLAVLAVLTGPPALAWSAPLIVVDDRGQAVRLTAAAAYR